MTNRDQDRSRTNGAGLPAHVREAAAAAGRSLPAHDTIVAAEPRAAADALPGPGSRAVTLDVSGAATGTVALLVGAELAEAVQNGPLGASDLVAALGAPLADSIASLELNFGAALHAGVAEVVEAEAMSFGPGAVAVPLIDGGHHVATLVVEVTASATPVAAEQAVEFTPFVEAQAAVGGPRSLELLHDVEMAITVELGRTRMAVRDLLSLAPGAVIELDRAAGSPVDVLVNGKLIARGEVVVIDEEFGIRISEIVELRNQRP